MTPEAIAEAERMSEEARRNWKYGDGSKNEYVVEDGVLIVRDGLGRVVAHADPALILQFLGGFEE